MPKRVVMKKKKNKELNIQNESKKTCFTVADSGINFVLSLVIPAVAALALMLVFAFVAGLSGSDYATFTKTNVARVLELIYSPIVFFLIYFVYCKVFNYDYFKPAEIKFKLNLQKVLICIIIALIAVFLMSPFISLLDYAYSLMNFKPDNSLPYVMDNGFRYVLGLVIMAALPAICEELLFRGLIQKGLMQKFNPHIAILISGTLFMLLHGSLQQTVFQFVLGIILGYATYYGGSLVYSIIMHFVNNAVAVTFSFVYTLKGIDPNAQSVYKNAWEYCLPVLLFVIAVAGVVGLIFLLRHVNKLESINSSIESNEKVDAKVSNDEVKTTKAKKGKIVKAVEVKENSVNDKVKNEVTENNGNVKTKKLLNEPLTKAEKLWLIGGVILGIVIWIVNTASVFLKL